MQKPSKSGEPITSPYIAILFAVGFAVMSLILILLDVKESLYWGGILAIIFFVLFIHFIWIWDKTTNQKLWIKLSIVCIGGVIYFGLVGKQVLYKYHEEHAAKVTLEQRYKVIEQITLHDLFEQDFRDTQKIRQGNFSGTAGGRPFTVQAQLYENDEEHSMFVGYFIPSHPKTEEICYLLRTQYTKILAWSPQIYSTTVDTTQQISTRDLKFTNRVFIYHEDHLEPLQIASLIKLYSDEGISVIFRGPEYRDVQMFSKLAQANANQNQATPQ